LIIFVIQNPAVVKRDFFIDLFILNLYTNSSSRTNYFGEWKRIMKQYLDVLRDIRENGVKKGDRTGTGTLSLFGKQMRFDLSEGFPVVTTKKLFLKGVIVELIWFLRGETNIRYLLAHGVHIWDEWPYKAYCESRKKDSSLCELSLKEFADLVRDDDEFSKKWGDLGPVYGSQWRHWKVPGGEIDQLRDVIEQIKKNPNSRRLIVTAWNPAEVDNMKLPPCHCLFQFYVANGKLSCHLYQRSCDMFLGVPFNIASYAFLTMMIAEVTGLAPGEFVHTLADAHIYMNHLEQVDLQLSREPRPLPKLVIARKVESIFDYRPEDFSLSGYDPHPPIKGEVSV